MAQLRIARKAVSPPSCSQCTCQGRTVRGRPPAQPGAAEECPPNRPLPHTAAAPSNVGGWPSCALQGRSQLPSACAVARAPTGLHVHTCCRCQRHAPPVGATAPCSHLATVSSATSITRSSNGRFSGAARVLLRRGVCGGSHASAGSLPAGMEAHGRLQRKQHARRAASVCTHSPATSLLPRAGHPAQPACWPTHVPACAPARLADDGCSADR